jgi:hypothetical protein
VIQDPSVSNRVIIILDFSSVSTHGQYHDTRTLAHVASGIQSNGLYVGSRNSSEFIGSFSQKKNVLRVLRKTSLRRSLLHFKVSYGFTVLNARVILFKPVRKVRPSFLPIFTKLTNALQYYVQTFHAESHPNRSLNVGITVRNVFTTPMWHMAFTLLVATTRSHFCFYGRLLCRMLPKSDEGQNFICFRSKAWFSLHRISRHPHLLSDATSISSVPNFTQKGY